MTTPEQITARLAHHLDLFANLFIDITPEQAQWIQEPGKWSLLMVACHLRDEEREDFRTRLRMVLETPGMPFPGINPTGWVVERNYGAQDFQEVVTAFLQERAASIDWLGSLKDPNWDNATVHPRLGPMSGHFILANWLAHDLLHIRQILRLQYTWLQHTSGQPLHYAGYW